MTAKIRVPPGPGSKQLYLWHLGVTDWRWEGGGEKLAGGHGLTAVATDWLMRDTDRLMGATDWLMGASEWLMGVTDWMMGVTDWLMWDGLADGRHGLADEGRTS